MILHESAVGDFMTSTGALREIRRFYPDAHITLSVTPRVSELVAFCPYADEILVNDLEIRIYGAGLFEKYAYLINFAGKILTRRYDVCYVFDFATYPPLLAYMSGAKERVSYRHGVEPNRDIDEKDFDPKGGTYSYFFAPLLTVEVPRNKSCRHMADHSFNIVEHRLLAPIRNRELEVWPAPVDYFIAKELLKPEADKKFYAICMGGSHMRKMWPPQYYAKLTQKIVEQEPSAKFVILGGGSLDTQSAMIFKQSLDEKFFAEHIIELTNRCNCRQSAAVYMLCDMYIGNDTGNMLIAAGAKTPILNPNCFPADVPMGSGAMPKLFGAYHVPAVIVQPKHALPECRNSKISYGCTVPDRPHCITQITVEKMFEAYNILKERIAANNIEPLFIS
ncbi:MAG: glycosyltransferase family 9 protein [Selenomonadaceae bacterium]|nr:glycosyltransferase family 9 protein [Selenomonadaceae bacterium]